MTCRSNYNLLLSTANDSKYQISADHNEFENLETRDLYTSLETNVIGKNK